MDRRLQLIVRQGCHLCDEMDHALARLQQTHHFDWHCVDVDADANLVRLYNYKVPVLLDANGQEICHYFLDEQALIERLSPN